VQPSHTSRACLRGVPQAYKGILLRRKFAAVSRQVTRLQAHVRRRAAVKRYRRILRTRANAVAKVQATFRMFSARRR
jgi:hypothetical protein